MENTSAVIGFLKGVPQFMQHEEEYRRAVASTRNGELQPIDMGVWEKACIGIGEHNLLRALPFAEKFTLPGMNELLRINSQSLSKQKDKDLAGKGTLTHSCVYEETYIMNDPVELVPAYRVVNNANRPGMPIPDNHPMYAQFMAGVTGLASTFLNSIALSFLGEKLVLRHDMRHILLKGYLMLMSYNLASVSQVKKLRRNSNRMTLHANIDPEVKMLLMTMNRVVVDADALTNDELWLFNEMCGPYPSREWGHPTIYSNIKMEADDVVFFSRREASEIPCDRGFGSPERMWNDLVNIAIKFSALDDLRCVVQATRGIPGMMRTVNQWSGKFQFHVEYPLSYSLCLAVNSKCPDGVFSTRHSNYFATSKCLVADLLLTKMMEMSMFNIIEESGALGHVGCPTGGPVADTFFNATLRSYGLSDNLEKVNFLLQEWRGIRGCGSDVMFGSKLRNTVARMAAAIKGGDSSFLRPQLLFSIPVSECKNTTWGIIRGWRFQGSEILDTPDNRVKQNQITKGYTWVMGVGKDVPRLGMNALGSLLLEKFSLEEVKFMQCANGNYEISLVRHVIEGELGARTDEFELGARSFYHSNFPGTRCTIIYDKAGVSRIVSDPDLGEEVIGSTLDVHRQDGGDVDKDIRVNVASFGGSNSQVQIRNGLDNERIVDLVGSGPRRRGEATFQDRQVIRTQERRGNPVANALGGVNPSTVQNKESDAPLTGDGFRREAGTGRGRGNGSRGRGGRSSHTLGDHFPPLPRSNGYQPRIQFVNRNASTLNGARMSSSAGVAPDSCVATAGEPVVRSAAPASDAAASTVSMVPRGEVPLSTRPRMRMVGGKVVGVEATRCTGENIILCEREQTELAPEGTLSGYLLQTVGDGRCGIHAIVQDFRVRGMIREEDMNEKFEAILDRMQDPTWQCMTDLGAYLNAMGMGLVVMEDQSKTMHRFGTDEAEHIVYLFNKGGHYQTFIPNPDGPDIMDGWKYTEGRATPRDMNEMWPLIQGAFTNARIQRENLRRMGHDVPESPSYRR